MLPGFRFLFGAVMFLMSILVFGFGAAALLRTAHEEFATAPAWRPAPETHFAQAPETTPATLALLRVDDAPKEMTKQAAREPVGDTLDDADKAEPTKAEPGAPNDTPPSAATDPAAVLSPQPDLDKTAALQPSDGPPSAVTVPDPAPPQAEAQAATDQTQLAAVQPSTDTPAPVTTAPASDATPPPVTEAAPVAPEVPSAPPLSSLATKIATLGGPPVAIDMPKAETEKPERSKDRSGVRKRQAHRAVHRRRIAALRLQQQLAAQQQQNPFGQAPVGQTPVNPAR